jgi:NAD(P)-dependent dehydrogenase (short-subunit alcohol dehydrogenase family)
VSRPSALVTGGSRGIGFGIAASLAEQGWGLTIAARDQARLDDAKGKLEALGGSVEVVAADMADEAALTTVLERHAATWDGAMNALILAAGVGSAAPIDGYPVRRLDKQLAVNFRAPFLLVSAALPMLRAGAIADPARGGRIVALTSMEGEYPEVGLSAYGATKAALSSLVRSLNIEEGANGVTATSIAPGYVDTDMSAWANDRIPADKMITVADVVKVVDMVLALSPNAVVPHLIINRVGTDPYHA